MQLADLSPTVLEQIRALRYDYILEKHEGPGRWSAVLQYYEPEFLLLDGFYVLLPIGQDRHPNITVVRRALSADGSILVLFLKDTTYVSRPEDEVFEAGRIAICERMAGAEFYIATVYHEWFIVENEGLSSKELPP
jgi:hypothetical protein